MSIEVHEDPYPSVIKEEQTVTVHLVDTDRKINVGKVTLYAAKGREEIKAALKEAIKSLDITI